MRKNKILTIDDLVKFCQDQNFTQFSSKDSGYSLHVQVPCENFELEKDDDPITLYANVRLMHTGANRNHSSLTEKAAKNCLSKIAYKPVLADFTDVNGELDFTYHAMEFNEDGTRTYIERQVGCFTSDKPYMEQDPNNEERKYIFAKIAIPREYTAAADIIERKGGTKVSAELAINDMSYSVDDGLLLEDVEVMAVTLLGVDPDTGEQVQEGMQGAYLQIEDFSADNNSIINKAELKEEIISEILSRIDNKQAEFSAEEKTTRKEEINPVDNENVNVEFEEAETAEVEEAEAKPETEEVEEATEEEKAKPEADEAEEDAEETPEVVDDFADDDNEGNDEPSEDEDHQSVSAIEDEDSTGAKVENSLNSINIAVGEKTFELSLDDVNYSLNCLVNDMYSETDNTYYMTVVYPESKHVVMIDAWNSCRAYKQSYKDRKGVYSLVGERIPVRSMWVTADEEAELDKLRSNYSAIESELNDYKFKELHSRREEIIAAEEYAVLKNDKDFKELKDNMDNYSVDDLSNKADLIFAKFMKSHKNFSAKASTPAQVVFMGTGADNTNEAKLPYGGLFKDFKSKK